MKKRIFPLLLVAALVSGVMTGCASSSKELPADTKTTEAPVAQAEDGSGTTDGADITVLCGYASEDPHGKYIYQYAEDFTAATGKKVEIQAISTNDIYAKLAAMATNPADIPTLFFSSADQVATLYDLGLTEDINNHISQETKDSFANGAYEACIIDGQMVFYPIAVQPTAVIYRKDRFLEAGLKVPTSWSEFVANAKALTTDTDGDGENDQWGFSMVGSNNSSGQSRFMSYLWSYGYKLIYQDEAGKWMTDISTDPDFVSAFTTWTDMNTEGIVPTGITEVDYATSANYFAMGYTNMFLTGSNALGVAYANNPDLKGNLASFTMPGDAPGTMLNVEGYAMSAHASDEQKATATEFLTYFTSHDEDMQFWNASGKIPSTKAGQSVEYISGEDYAGFLEQIKKGCLPTLTFPGVGGLKSALGNAYSAVFSGEKTNEQAVAGLVKEMEELLEDYN